MITHTLHCNLCSRKTDFNQGLSDFIGLDMSAAQPIVTNNLSEAELSLIRKQENARTHICLTCVEILNRSWRDIMVTAHTGGEPPF